MANKHFLLVSLAAQGHVNPTLHFAKHLLRLGTKVTLLVSVSSSRCMDESQFGDGFTLATFSDGYDDGLKGDGIDKYLAEFRLRGREALCNLIVSRSNEGRPFACVVHTLVLHWVNEVARELHVPSALLWIQSATALDIYYYYFNGYGDIIERNKDEPSFSIEFPGLPLLSHSDLPSILISKDQSFALKEFEELFKTLGMESKPKVLLNTFDTLEHQAITAIGNKFDLIPIGPLNPSCKSDLGHVQKEEIEWLNSKPNSSVVYVSFGSISLLSKMQMEEIARGLLDSGYPFLWVIRSNENRKDEEKLSCLDELEKQGKIVPWCSQTDVLNHPSLGCFVTHCGWNSTIETLVAGVPVVTFPQWTDQCTNAKMMEDVWKIGVKVKRNVEGLVEGKEIMRCLEMVMGGGERGVEMGENAKKLKRLTAEAATGSVINLNAFINEV